MGSGAFEAERTGSEDEEMKSAVEMTPRGKPGKVQKRVSHPFHRTWIPTPSRPTFPPRRRRALLSRKERRTDETEFSLTGPGHFKHHNHASVASLRKRPASPRKERPRSNRNHRPPSSESALRPRTPSKVPARDSLSRISSLTFVPRRRRMTATSGAFVVESGGETRERGPESGGVLFVGRLGTPKGRVCDATPAR